MKEFNFYTRIMKLVACWKKGFYAHKSWKQIEKSWYVMDAQLGYTFVVI